MSKTILALITGAACASGWWAVALFPLLAQTPFVAAVSVLTMAAITFIVHETLNIFDRDK